MHFIFCEMVSAAADTGKSPVYRKSSLTRIALLSAMLAGVAPVLAHAENNDLPFDPALCGGPISTQPDPANLAAREDPATPVTIDADRVDYFGATQSYRFAGNVLLQQADQQLQADRIVFNQETSRADASGNLRYYEDGLTLWAEEGHLYFDVTRGALSTARFQFEHSYTHGDADEIIIEDSQRSRYRDVRFTTCPPDRTDWWLRGSELRTDREEGMGSARHAWLQFMGVPLFYTPYISFPIDDRRRSGLLAPSYRQSSRSGFDLRIPYYWNMAPNYDAVLAPRIVTRRGLMLDTEWRLLTRQFAAETDLQYLPDDDLYGDDRWLASLRMESPEERAIQWELDLNRVSDEDYLRDFGSGIASSSVSHLPSLAIASYQTLDLRVSAQAQTWQTLDQEVSSPYRILPRVRVDYNPAPIAAGLDYRLESELTYFDHANPSARDTGVRAHVVPTLSRTWDGLAYFITPSFAVSHTEYWLDRPDNSAAENPSSTIPIFSVEAGIFLERDFALGNRALMQTLEPRLFYLYVPEYDQSDQPRFDTRDSELTLGQLFRTNRFTGPDRQGDANQVSAALTSRVVDRQSGREHLSASVGQIFYLEDREVTINDALEDPTRNSSDIMAELRSQLPGGFNVFADYRWDPYDNRTRRSGLRLQYRPQPDAVINLGYRSRTERDSGSRELEQTDLSFVWPIGARWHAIGGWRYSLLDNETLEQFAGFEFDNCCWSFRLLAREYVRDLDREPEREVMFQLEFTGLADVGRSVQDFMIDAVTGYRPRR
ncbi:hypothetical protein CAI21_01145 [Alkalilimnicola ehrlichii]|uniref:LPS-assembly protein LptD n=2 Tax=Alkalilimnicola ehrlichii TaxID=351052 RepID=A0A3E0X1G6_9GAMM|nr:hypothetical protein CAI21_01145 [Alkalilimnicola ehrlichii]RFA39451.1 hypothetical protein CAL65_01270 [Alkalilimnicola ehrlichii]